MEKMIIEKEKKDILIENALALIIEHNVPEQTIRQWIRKALHERVLHLPEVPVAISKCYGGFGLSKHFKTFMKDLNQDKTYKQVVEAFLQRPIHEAEAVHEYADRIAIALAIPLYGQHLCQEYPDIALLFSKMEPVQDLLLTASVILQYRKSMMTTFKNFDLIKDALASPYEFYFAKDSSEELSPYTSMITNKYFSTTSYSRSELQEYIEKLDLEALIAIDIRAILQEERGVKWTSIDQRICELALVYMTEKMEENGTRTQTKKKPFVDVVAEELDDSVLSLAKGSDVMEFLAFLKKESQELFDTLDSNLESLETNLGLYCSSHTNAHLRIAKVPQYAYFSINEYDGLESISCR